MTAASSPLAPEGGGLRLSSYSRNIIAATMIGFNFDVDWAFFRVDWAFFRDAVAGDTERWRPGAEGRVGESMYPFF